MLHTKTVFSCKILSVYNSFSSTWLTGYTAPGPSLLWWQFFLEKAFYRCLLCSRFPPDVSRLLHPRWKSLLRIRNCLLALFGIQKIFVGQTHIHIWFISFVSNNFNGMGLNESIYCWNNHNCICNMFNGFIPCLHRQGA